MTSQIFGIIRDGVLQQRANGELIICLMNAMPDKTIFAFSRTCRLAYELAKPQMKRRKLRMIYTNFSLADEYPCRLLELLDEQPEGLPYIKTLICRTNYINLDPRIGEWTENFRRVQQGQHDNILPSIRQFCALQYIRGLTDTELRDLETGNEVWRDIVKLASSLLCPNLDCLHIQSRINQIARAITPITRYMNNVENNQSAHNQSDTIARDLPKPQRLKLLGQFSYPGLADILRVFSLPSLRTAIACHFFLYSFPAPMMTNPLDMMIPASKIERLTLIQCEIRPPMLGALIEGMPNLEYVRHQDDRRFNRYILPPSLPAPGPDVSGNESSPLNAALRSLADMEFPGSEGLDAYAKLLVLHMFSRPNLMSRGLKVGVIANESLEWTQAGVIVKKPHISPIDIDHGTIDHLYYD